MMKMNKEENRIIIVLFSLSLVFIALIVYLSYFEVFEAASIKNNNYNRRVWLEEEYVTRGSIYDRNHTLLASSTRDKEQNQERDYKYGNLYSHIIGYTHRELGKEGLEKNYNDALINLSESNSLNEFKKVIASMDKELRGNDLILTLDHGLQQYAKDLLGKQKGSIVVMNPSNGEIYTMVSYPDFDPNHLKENWDSILQNPDSPLLNRATSGLYTPGSIFKVITTSSALESEGINTDFDCKGQVNIDGYVLRDYNGIAHGHVDLHDSLVKSCNVAFSQIGVELGGKKLEETSEKFMLNHKIPFDLDTKQSTFPKSKMSKADLGASGIGQGKTLVTPLNMAMMASAIANDGKIMKPNIVKEILTPAGKSLSTKEPEVLSTAISPEIARSIKDMMVDVVNQGTGKNAKTSAVQIAGKTGTAENAHENAHAWFVGFAPAEEPQVAIAVILENHGSTGGSSAAPMARKIITQALKELR